MAKGSSLSLILKERKVREALRNPIEVLKNLTKKSKNENYRFQRLYRNLYNPDFYWLAYKNIYANKGSITAGADGKTLDGMSEERINKIIQSLKDHSYKPNPAKRIYIAKKNSNKKRPLGIPSSDDKLLQEVVKMILESIYEPQFSNSSHGFRPRKSCQTALKQIQKTFTGTNWFVEGDIKACFDSFDHHVVIELLKKRIDDEQFIQLIWKFLKAGYMEQWTFNKTYNGVPQGSGVSPILANIYLHELDKFIEDYKVCFDKGTKKKLNPEYKKAFKRTSYFRCKGKEIWNDISEEQRKARTSRLRELEQIERKMTASLTHDSQYKRIQYVRYADDFIIGVIGSKDDAEQIKKDVKEFLMSKLKLEMSDTKTKVTHTSNRARFLGYDITVSRSQSITETSNGHKQRCQSYVVKLLVPREKWVNKLLEYKAIKIKVNENGKEKYVALHRGKLVNKTDIEILATYNAEIRGLYNFYSIANDSYKIGIFANLMKYSMYKTFANKYKTNVHEIKRRYCINDLFTLTYQTKSGPKKTIFYKDGFKRKLEPTKFDNVSELPQYSKYLKVNTLKQRVEKGYCELCYQKSNKLEIHQVKKLKELKGNQEWVLRMKDMRRKTLVVCPACHKIIHS